MQAVRQGVRSSQCLQEPQEGDHKIIHQWAHVVVFGNEEVFTELSYDTSECSEFCLSGVSLMLVVICGVSGLLHPRGCLCLPSGLRCHSDRWRWGRIGEGGGSEKQKHFELKALWAACPHQVNKPNRLWSHTRDPVTSTSTPTPPTHTLSVKPLCSLCRPTLRKDPSSVRSVKHCSAPLFLYSVIYSSTTVSMSVSPCVHLNLNTYTQWGCNNQPFTWAKEQII